MRSLDWKKYVIAFLITAGIFFTAIFISNYFGEKRAQEIRSIEDKIAINILSLETQFDLLQQSSCADIAENSILSTELNTLANRLSVAEEQLGTDNAEVIKLKQSHTLLQIKDYLLMKKVSEKCNLEPIFLFYFYSNAGDCPECIREGYVLTALRKQYPHLRVYAFDYNLDLSVLKTLISINNIENNLPAIVIDDEAYYGFQEQEDIEKFLPPLEKHEE